MKFASAIVLLVLASTASAQFVNTSAIQAVLSGYTGGSSGASSDTYLTTMATTLANGFLTSMGGVIQNITDVIGEPSSYEQFLSGLEDEFCTAAYINETVTMPARIVGPEINLEFSGGACLLNETQFLAGSGSLSVDCIKPAVTIAITPAEIRAPYKTATKFTDKECKVSKEFGEATDNVVFVLDKGAFNITGLVDTLQAGLTGILGQFSNLVGSVVPPDGVSSVLNTVNTATALLG